MVYSLGQPTNWEELESRFTSFALKPTATVAEENQFFQDIKSTPHLLNLFHEMLNARTFGRSKEKTLVFKAIFSIIPPYRSDEAIALVSKSIFGNSQQLFLDSINSFLTQVESHSKSILKTVEGKNVWKFHECLSALDQIKPDNSRISITLARTHLANSQLWSDISTTLLNLDDVTKDVFFYAIRDTHRTIQFIFFKNLVDCVHLTNGRELFQKNRFGEQFISNIVLNNDLEMMQRVLHFCQQDETLKSTIFPFMFRHAVQREMKDIVRALLQLSDHELKCTMFSQMNDNVAFNPLSTAITDDNLELAQMILDACGESRFLKTLLFQLRDGHAPFVTAIATENFDIARAMMKACGDDADLKRVLIQPDAKGKTAIELAHDRGHVEIEAELKLFMENL